MNFGKFRFIFLFTLWREEMKKKLTVAPEKCATVAVVKPRACHYNPLSRQKEYPGFCEQWKVCMYFKAWNVGRGLDFCKLFPSPSSILFRNVRNCKHGGGGRETLGFCRYFMVVECISVFYATCESSACIIDAWLFVSSLATSNILKLLK